MFLLRALLKIEEEPAYRFPIRICLLKGSHFSIAILFSPSLKLTFLKIEPVFLNGSMMSSVNLLRGRIDICRLFPGISELSPH
jgi:hypothetical protein